MKDLLAENILKEKVESSNYGWLDNQREAVIAAMNEYYNKKRAPFDDTLKMLNGDIIRLKNFVARHKPKPSGPKTIESHKQYRAELDEWDQLMRL
jgi:hypothetical protein